MRTSKQLFSLDMKVPKDYSGRKTSLLLENGTFTFFRDPGVPFYLPIGRRVLNKLETLLLDEAEKLGMVHIEIPAIMKDEVLEEGEEITNTFNDRIVRLSNNSLEGYHLLTTPEPMILDLASVSLTSHNQLPIRMVYNVDVIRGVQKPKGMLKGRQFKTFMGTSLDEDSNSLKESLELFGNLSDNVFKKLGIEVYKRRNQGNIDIEQFYFGTEGDNLPMPEIDPEKRVKGMSLAMVYHYNPEKKVKARFRDKQNKNSRVFYGTYGLGTQRTFYALFDSHRDSKGFDLPTEFAPFRYTVIPLNKKDIKTAEIMYDQLQRRETILDDRTNLILGERASFSDYIGVPWKIIIGNERYTLRNRNEDIERIYTNSKDLMNSLNIKDAN